MNAALLAVLGAETEPAFFLIFQRDIKKITVCILMYFFSSRSRRVYLALESFLAALSASDVHAIRRSNAAAMQVHAKMYTMHSKAKVCKGVVEVKKKKRSKEQMTKSHFC